MNWIALSSENTGVSRDPAGVPVEWSILHVGANPVCQEGRDMSLDITPDGMKSIVEYHEKKGEKIPVDSDHYLFVLARKKGLEEAETLRLFPSGIAALGFGTLTLSGEDLWHNRCNQRNQVRLERHRNRD